MTEPDAGVDGIDAARTERWYLDHIAGTQPPLAFEQIPGGRSNLTFRVVDSAGVVTVLRRPPVGPILPTAHNMEREHRILSALGPTSVPVPPTLGLCTDEAVNGAPFYVMGFVEGRVLDGAEDGAAVDEARRKPLSRALVEVLAELHSCDVDAIGLGDLARREGYVERQIRRWTAQWEASKTRDLPIMDELQRRLAGAVPAQQRVVVAHGDYRFGNCLVDTDRARIAAVLDWELSTLGDPLADLGYLGIWWNEPGTAVPSTDPTIAGGYPPFVELVEHYGDLTGLDLTDIGYYVAFSDFRLAVISQGVHARYRGGQMGAAPTGPDLEFLAGSIEPRVQRALGALTDR